MPIQSTFPSRQRFVSYCVVFLFLWLPLAASALDDLLEDDGDGGISLEEEGAPDPSLDYDQLKWSHLSEVDGWQGGIRHWHRKHWQADANYTWHTHSERGYGHLKSFCQRARYTVSPATDKAIWTHIDVPEAATYRVWLCYLAKTERHHPLKLTFGEHALVFNESGLDPTRTGNDHERARPICFEAEHERLGMPGKETFIWEYRDLELPAGRQRVSLQSALRPVDFEASQKRAFTPVRVDALFLTRSRAFRPSKAMDYRDNTLGKTWLRFRVATESHEPVTFRCAVTYHWRHAVHGMTEPLWYSHLGQDVGAPGTFAGDANEPVEDGGWSKWVDASSNMLNSGPYFSGYISAIGGKPGTTYEAQLAWFPDPGAVMKSISIPTAQSPVGTFLGPHHRSRLVLPMDSEDNKQAVWGMRTAEWLGRFRNALDVAAEHQAAVHNVDLPEGPLPSKLFVTTMCRPDPVAADDTTAMLRSLGMSHLLGVKKSVLSNHGMHAERFLHCNDLMYFANTHCPRDPRLRENLAKLFKKMANDAKKQGWSPTDVTVCKLGDEIGAIRSANHINRCTDCRLAFHNYLGKWGPASFFGDEDFRHLNFIAHRGGDGIFERRLYYASAQFNFDFTAEFYRQASEEITKIMPNCRTYCNFSPHPVIFGGTMNHSDWFNITRRGGTTMAWSESWASNASWGFWMGMQIVSYYAAMVECGAVGSDGHSGFYAVGGTAKQLLSCVNRGIRKINLYGYGPEYNGAEASNFWSERHGSYANIASGLRAVGLADEMIAEGQRETSPAALLYNRDHEIWHPEVGKVMQTDRVGTFVALEHAGVPVDIVLAEDLVAGNLPYKAVYLNGFNLSKEVVAALRKYVEAGGIVVAAAGSGMYDRFNGQQNGADALFGVRSLVVGWSVGGHDPGSVEQHEAIDTMKFADSALSWPVVGMKCRLTPVDGMAVDILATYADGSPALAKHKVGAGAVYTYGVLPGLIYRARAPRHNPEKKGVYNQYVAEDAAFIAAPVVAKHQRRHSYSHRLVETRRFDHKDTAAITLTNFYYHPLETGQLKIYWPADRGIKHVKSALTGELTPSRDGDWVTVSLPMPHDVDVVVIR